MCIQQKKSPTSRGLSNTEKHMVAVIGGLLALGMRWMYRPQCHLIDKPLLGQPPTAYVVPIRRLGLWARLRLQLLKGEEAEAAQCGSEENKLAGRVSIRLHTCAGCLQNSLGKHSPLGQILPRLHDRDPAPRPPHKPSLIPTLTGANHNASALDGIQGGLQRHVGRRASGIDQADVGRKLLEIGRAHV